LNHWLCLVAHRHLLRVQLFRLLLDDWLGFFITEPLSILSLYLLVYLSLALPNLSFILPGTLRQLLLNMGVAG
jgi:hypothetical protein